MLFARDRKSDFNVRRSSQAPNGRGALCGEVGKTIIHRDVFTRRERIRWRVCEIRMHRCWQTRSEGKYLQFIKIRDSMMMTHQTSNTQKFPKKMQTFP